MKTAFTQAGGGMRKKHGGTFGALIVKDNKFVAKVHNKVLLHNDPRDHAEILVIRKAVQKLKSFDPIWLYTVHDL
jgi:guanine deaminase